MPSATAGWEATSLRLPVITGLIDRRILVNYRVGPGVLQKLLPPLFRPKTVNGSGMAGICLIRLKQIRPRHFPVAVGLCSENAAHRIAVEWDHNGEHYEGVYIPRRDTSSRLNTWAGGHIFPGQHRYADFRVKEDGEHFEISVAGVGNGLRVHVRGQVTDSLSSTSVFTSLDEASKFFARGALGYSPTDRVGEMEGLELRCFDWKIEPLAVERIESSFFADQTRFPEGSIEFDCALLMAMHQA